jgi:hypothetical protein
VPGYSPFLLNTAAEHGFGVEDAKAGIILLKSTVDSHPATALWDTGAEADFVSWRFIEKHGLQERLRPSARKVKYADGSVRDARGELQLPIRLLTQGKPFECSRRVIVADLQSRFDLVLGTPFCREHQPRPDWERMTIALPTRRQSGEVVWQPALRTTLRVSDPDLSGAGLCEISVGVMDDLSSAGLLDRETMHCINLRPDHWADKPDLSGTKPKPKGSGPSAEEIAETALCEKLRQQLFDEFKDVFPDKLPAISKDSVAPGGVTHRIQLKEGALPYSRPLRRMSTQELDELKRQLQEYLDDGRLRPSESPWGTNVIFAKKKDGSLRFCVDYRGLNDLTIRNSYPLPHTEDLFDRLVGARFFSKIDLRTGFYQILLAEGDREKTAFRTRYGHFEWTVLPMGLTNAPATFQHLMNQSFREMLDRCVLVFLDDIVVYSRTLEDHERDVRAVLTRLRTAGLFAKQSKCDLFRAEIEFLGHNVGRDGLRVMADKVRDVRNWPTPRSASELRSFLGLAGYYRRFIHGFSGHAAPLHDLTHTADGRKYEWLPVHQRAADTLKAALTAAPTLALPDPDRQYVVNTDASDFATGAVLQQDQGNGLQPVAFCSHKMSDTERRYPTHDREMLAIIHMLGEWRTYLQGRQPFVIRIRTDHNSLQYFMTQQSLSARQARWLDKLSDFDFKIEYIRGPTNVVADALSRRADYMPEPPASTVKADAPAKGTLAALTLASLDQHGSATLTKSELLSLPLFSAPCPESLLATARLVSHLQRPTATREPLSDEQRQAQVAEATKSHPQDGSRPTPDKDGIVRMPSQQCTAFTAKGLACKRRTLRGHQCGDHARILQRLTVAKSGLPGAGLGLFLAKGARPLRPKERISVYSGDYIPLAPGDDTTGEPYFLEITKNLAVDAARTNTALARWANDPRGGIGPNGKPLRSNSELVADRRNKQGALRATKWIHPGQEILTAYGQGYWRTHGRKVTAASVTAAQLSGHRAELPAAAAAPPLQGLLAELRAAAATDAAYQAVLKGGELGELSVRDGLLYDGERVIVPNDLALRTRLLREAHDSTSAGHSGVAATKDRLSTRVHWAGLASDVHDYVVSCDSCQRNKVEQRRTAGLLRPPPVPDEPGYAINMDFVFGLPETERGYTGYLSITCRLSNWLEPALCRDSVTAEGSAQLVFDRWVRTFGLPARIVSDRDPRFTGRFWRELWRLLDTKLDMSTTGHPQTDGKAENRQRTANTMLRHYVDFEQKTWDMQLLHAAHAINHTKSVATGLTPFEVMFRRAPRLPLDIALTPSLPLQRGSPSPPSALPAVNNFLERHRYIWARAKENALKAQADQKTHADKHRREESFAVGDEVLLSTKDLRLAADSTEAQRASKLTARFVGPLKVIRVINPNAYEVELPPQLRIHPVQNISKLRRYRRSPDRFAPHRPQPIARPPPECIDPAGDAEYEVERILAARRHGRRQEYLVKWLGYPNEECSWEPFSGLKCPQALADFHARQNSDLEPDSNSASRADSAEQQPDLDSGHHSEPDELNEISHQRLRSLSPLPQKKESPGRLTPRGG